MRTVKILSDSNNGHQEELLQYINDISENPESIFDDIQEILQLTQKEHFLQVCHLWEQVRATLASEPATEGKEKIISPYAQKKSMETFENCAEMLENSLSKQLSAIECYDLDKTKAYQMIFKKASEWYTPTISEDSDLLQYFQKLKLQSTESSSVSHLFTRELQHLPIPYSKVSIAMSKMNSKGETANAISGQLILESNGVKVQIENFADIAGAFGINTHKLFCAGLIQFANNNNIGDTSNKINYSVSISLKEYALLCGYDVETHQTDSPEKEKQRVKNLLKYIRKQISSDLNILYSSNLTWSESTNKKNNDYLNVRIISAVAIKSGYIYMTFSPDFASYLKLRRLTQYPVALLSVDARSANAYRIGQAMSFHYNNDNNLKSQNANRMKISTLLEYTDLPTIDKVRKNEKSWTDRIKEPFEKALDELYQKGILSDWWYCKSKDIQLTDEEAQGFSDFEEWSNMLVHFEISQATDHSLRLTNKEEKRAKQVTTRRRNGPKKKISNNDSNNE